MAGGVHPELYKYLAAKFGHENVCWPIVAYDLNTQKIQGILFEVNQRNQVNSHITHAFFDSKNFPEYKLDYQRIPRQTTPFPLDHSIPWRGPREILCPEYKSSYEYVVKNRDLNTIDLDYSWRHNACFFGLETTSFFMKMKTEAYAEHLVKQVIEKRLSRKGAHHLNILAQIAEKNSITMSLVFLNVVEHTNLVVTDSYVYLIPLTVENASKLHSGIFVQGKYMPYSEWLTSL